MMWGWMMVSKHAKMSLAVHYLFSLYLFLPIFNVFIPFLCFIPFYFLILRSHDQNWPLIKWPYSMPIRIWYTFLLPHHTSLWDVMFHSNFFASKLEVSSLIIVCWGLLRCSNHDTRIHSFHNYPHSFHTSSTCMPGSGKQKWWNYSQCWQPWGFVKPRLRSKLRELIEECSEVRLVVGWIFVKEVDICEGSRQEVGGLFGFGGQCFRCACGWCYAARMSVTLSLLLVAIILLWIGCFPSWKPLPKFFCARR